MKRINTRVAAVEVKPLIVLAAGMAIVPLTLANAADVKVTGTVTYVIVSEESTKLSDGRTIMHSHDKGVVISDDPQSPIHLALEDCFDTVVLGADGSLESGAGYCDTFDKDGDGYWFTWTATETGTLWNVYHGTGKYEGMTGGGSSTTELMLPDRFSVTFEGTVTTK